MITTASRIFCMCQATKRNTDLIKTDDDSSNLVQDEIFTITVMRLPIRVCES
jgi:hypothetical protein